MPEPAGGEELRLVGRAPVLGGPHRRRARGVAPPARPRRAGTPPARASCRPRSRANSALGVARAHGGDAGAVEHPLDALERAPHRAPVAHLEPHPLAVEVRDRRRRSSPSSTPSTHLVAALERQAGDVRADEPGRPGYERTRTRLRSASAGGGGPRSGAGQSRQRTASGTAAQPLGRDRRAALHADAVGARRPARGAPPRSAAPPRRGRSRWSRRAPRRAARCARSAGWLSRWASSASRPPSRGALHRGARAASSARRASRRASISRRADRASSLHLGRESRRDRLPRAWRASRSSRTAPRTSRRTLVERHGIHVVPLYVVFGGDRTVPETDITDYDAFFEELRSAESLPTTSQPSVGDFTSRVRAAAGRRRRGGVGAHLRRPLRHARVRAARRRDARARGQGRRARARVRLHHRRRRPRAAGARRARTRPRAGVPGAEIVERLAERARASCSSGSPSTRSSSSGAAAASAPPAPGSARR